MQRWSLDDLLVEDGTVDRTLPPTPDFIEDRPQAGAYALLNRLEEEEREALYEIVGDEVRAEIRQELHGAYGQELEVLAAALLPLSKRIEAAVHEEMHAIAVGTVHLAMAMAERLARASIDADEGYLIRCVEELVERTQVGAALTVVAHPDEVNRLRHCHKELKDLNIVELVPDKGLPAGGCIVRSSGQEWDLTFKAQAATLGEKVQDLVASGAVDPRTEPTS